MTDLLIYARDVLSRAGYTVEQHGLASHPVLLFEDATYLGFVAAYPDVESIHLNRAGVEREFLARYTPDLRAAGDKPWNTYFVWLAHAEPTREDAASLAALEEDLAGARKIAVAGVQSVEDAEAALADLLPLQTRAKLQSVDIPEEIRLRTTELDPDAVEAFLRESAPEHVALVLQTLQS